MDCLDRLLEFLKTADRASAVKLVLHYAEDNGLDNAITHLLSPAMLHIGDQWEAGHLTLAQGFLASKVVEDVWEAYPHAEKSGTKSKLYGPVIMGNIEDDYLSLGRKMVSTFLRASGWTVIDLGNDVAPELFIETAIKNRAHVIGISAMMHTTALNIKKVRKKIDAILMTDRIKLAVGGAIFNLRPELVEEVGGDGTARNAVEAPALMEKLYKEALDL